VFDVPRATPSRVRLLGALLLTLAAAAVGAAPAGAAAVPARPADSFVESVGVNVHLGYTETPYAREAAIRDKLLDLGVRYVRDGISQGRPDVYRRLRELAQHGIRANLIVGDPLERWGVGPLDAQLDLIARELAPAGAVASLEGPNEYDIQGEDNWVGPLRDYQRRLFEGARARPALSGLPVLGPTVVYRENRDRLGDLSAWLDYGNMHPYPGGNAPDRDVHLEDEFRLASKNSAADPVQATETGYHNGTASDVGHLPASEQAAGVYMPRLFLDYFRRGVARTFAYELVDQRANRDNTDSEGSFGLLRSDFSEKPAYTALKRLLRLLSDRGPHFEARGLDLTVEGATTGLRQVLLQKRDGTHYLVLWRAAPVWDPRLRHGLASERGAVRLSVNGAAPALVVHRPNESAAPVERHAAGAPADLVVGPEVTVVEIGPGAAAPLRAFRPVCAASASARRLRGRTMRVLRKQERSVASRFLRPVCAGVKPAQRHRLGRWLRKRATSIKVAARHSGWHKHRRRARHRVIRAVVRNR
jgi:hypothetical protein